LDWQIQYVGLLGIDVIDGDVYYTLEQIAKYVGLEVVTFYKLAWFLKPNGFIYTSPGQDRPSGCRPGYGT